MGSGLIGRAASLPPMMVDALLASLLLIAAEAEVWAPGFPGSRIAAAAAVPVMTIPLSWRRRRPTAAAAAAYVAVGAQAVGGGQVDQSIAAAIAVLVVTYSLAAHAGEVRVAVGGFVLGQAALWLAVAVQPGGTAGDYAFSLVLGGGAWLGGYAVRSGRVVAATLEDRATRAEELSAAERAQAVADERARIAREMHDVLAHTMSVVVVQSGAARQLVRSDPERTESLLRSVEHTSRQALSELRRLLGLIDGVLHLDVAPQPGLTQLDELIDRARHSGLDITVNRAGDAYPLPPGIDLTAYRIVQEAITNALKHGRGPATVSVDYLSAQLQLGVCNRLRTSGASIPGSGHGLIGMQERVRLFGGTLTVSRTEDEFRLCARLPTAEEVR